MSTNIINSTERTKIHPHKFALWVAMGSISMMFAGFTSAYVVRQAQGNWRYYHLPIVFWISTFIILASSGTYILGLRSFRSRQMGKFRSLMSVTMILGLAFGVLQALGFYQLFHQLQPVLINGQVLPGMAPVRVNGNPSESFLYIIAGLHLLHMLGGIVALAIVLFRTFRANIRTYSATGLEIEGAYWHFVGILWIYLFVFFLVNQ